MGIGVEMPGKAKPPPRHKRLRLRLQPVCQRIQRRAFSGHIHKRLRAVLRLNVHPATAVGDDADV